MTYQLPSMLSIRTRIDWSNREGTTVETKNKHTVYHVLADQLEGLINECE